MKISCPNPDCHSHTENSHIYRDGSYLRRDDARTVQRYRCKSCGKRFSQATNTLEYRQKKRRVNQPLLHLLCSKVSIRRAALNLDINKNTVMAKIKYLAKFANQKSQKWQKKMIAAPVEHIQIDDLITKEQTKLKPLSVTIVVNADNREILGMKVSQIPAFGKLAEKGRERYGERASNHFATAESLIHSLVPQIAPDALIESDEHKSYPLFIKKHLPRAEHRAYPSDRATISGQGEMKKNRRDPIFCVNHTCAMLRDGISRLIRRSWCISQKAEMLQHHLDIFRYFFNQIYLVKMAKS